MTDTRAKLEPYWFQPEGHSCRFKLRPLTPSQVAEVTDHFKPESTNAVAFYKAAMFALVDFEGLTRNGEPMKYPKDKSDVSFELMFACGVDVYTQSVRTDDEDAEKN